MRKQLIAYLLQAAASLAAVTAGFVAHPIAGWSVLAVVATVHGIALEVEHAKAPATQPDTAEREKRGEG